MPSASPESRRKRRERRSHSKDRSRSPAVDRRRVERHRKGKDDQERGASDDRRRKDNDRDGQRAVRRTVEDRSSREQRRPTSSRHSKEDRSRRENVRVKEEPTSEDEEERRRRIERRRANNRNGEREERRDRDFGRRPGKVEVKKEESGDKKEEEEKPKEKVNFGLSGKLTEDTNVFNGVVIKYNEPTEARKPNKRWRLYPFKGEEPLPILPIHRQSAYLLGRERKIADIPIDHPSCSKQHAAIQFRAMQYEREDGRMGKRIRPYIIDLDSANGTYVNNGRIESRRYVELMEKDVVKFGFSSREYVLLHEGSVAGEDEVAPEDDPPEERENAEES